MNIYNPNDLKVILFLKFCNSPYILKLKTDNIKNGKASMKYKGKDLKNEPEDEEYTIDLIKLMTYLKSNDIVVKKFGPADFVYYDGIYKFKGFIGALMFSGRKQDLSFLSDDITRRIKNDYSMINLIPVAKINPKNAKIRKDVYDWTRKTIGKIKNTSILIPRFTLGLFDHYANEFTIDNAELYTICFMLIVSLYFTDDFKLFEMEYNSSKDEIDRTMEKILKNLDFKCLYDTSEDLSKKDISLTPIFTPLKELGSGAYGSVSIVKDTYGIKRCRKESNEDMSEEIDFLRMIDSKYVIPIYEHDEKWYTMPCMKGTLYDAILKKNIKDHKKIIRQLILGLYDIHRVGIVHADIKPQNILMDDEENIYYADFGISRVRDTESHYTLNTLWYRPAELCYEEKLGVYPVMSSADIWALGCIIGEIFYLRPLFPGACEMDQILQIVNICGVPPYKRFSVFPQKKTKNISDHFQVPEKYEKLINGMLNVNVEKRMTINDAKKLLEL